MRTSASDVQFLRVELSTNVVNRGVYDGAAEHAVLWTILWAFLCTRFLPRNPLWGLRSGD